MSETPTTITAASAVPPRESFPEGAIKPARSRARTVALGGAVLCGLIGLVIITAWLSRNTAVLLWPLGRQPVVFGTAAGMLVMSIGLVTLVTGRLRTAALTGWFLLALGPAELGTSVFGGRNIDHLFVSSYTEGGRSVGAEVMAPNTALCFFVMGLSILVYCSLGHPRRSRAMVVGGSIIGAVASLAAFGHQANVTTAYGWGNLTEMAVTTAAVMMIAAVALLAVAWEEGGHAHEGGPPDWLGLPVAGLAFAGCALLWLALGRTEEPFPAEVRSRMNSAAVLLSLLCAVLVGVAVSSAQAAGRGRRVAETESGRRAVAERAAQDSERRMVAVLERLPIGVFICDAKGQPYFANLVAQHLLGQGVRRIVDATQLASTYRAYVAGTDRLYPSDQTGVARALRGEESHFQDMEVHRAAGDVVPLEVWASPVYDAHGEVEFALIVMADISERQSAERRLIEQAALLDLSFDAVLLWSPDRKISFWNLGAQRCYGYSREEAIGREVADLLRTSYPDTRETIDRQLQEDGVWEGELVQQTKDGATIVVESRWALARSPDGSWASVMEVNRDITERRQADEALKVRSAALALANRDLERSNRDLEHFAYAASHDLSEPLRAIAGPISLVARTYEGRLDAESDELIAFAVDGCNRMQLIIDGLLAYSRVGRVENDPVLCDVTQVVRRTLDVLGPTIVEHHGTVAVGDLPQVVADADQLAQVFQNLIANAVKFVALGVEPRVSVTAMRQGAGWRFDVVDNGIGIDPGHRTQIFEMFRRLHGRGEYPGTGIGLALVQKIVERHGGTSGADVGPDGTGSRFWFTLPDARKVAA